MVVSEWDLSGEDAREVRALKRAQARLKRRQERQERRNQGRYYDVVTYGGGGGGGDGENGRANNWGIPDTRRVRLAMVLPVILCWNVRLQ